MSCLTWGHCSGVRTNWFIKCEWPMSPLSLGWTLTLPPRPREVSHLGKGADERGVGCLVLGQLLDFLQES